MSNDATQLLTAALALSEQERAEIAARLIDSLDDQADPGWLEDWDREIRRRLDEVDQGKVKPVPWTEGRCQNDCQ